MLLFILYILYRCIHRYKNIKQNAENPNPWRTKSALVQTYKVKCFAKSLKRLVSWADTNPSIFLLPAILILIRQHLEKLQKCTAVERLTLYLSMHARKRTHSHASVRAHTHTHIRVSAHTHTHTHNNRNNHIITWNYWLGRCQLGMMPIGNDAHWGCICQNT